MRGNITNVEDERTKEPGYEVGTGAQEPQKSYKTGRVMRTESWCQMHIIHNRPTVWLNSSLMTADLKSSKTKTILARFKEQTHEPRR